MATYQIVDFGPAPQDETQSYPFRGNETQCAAWLNKHQETVGNRDRYAMQEIPCLTSAELGNQHGYACPQCKDGEELHICAQDFVKLVPDGTDDSKFACGFEWDFGSAVICGCGWRGQVGQLLTLELED